MQLTSKWNFCHLLILMFLQERCLSALVFGDSFLGRYIALRLAEVPQESHGRRSCSRVSRGRSVNWTLQYHHLSPLQIMKGAVAQSLPISILSHSSFSAHFWWDFINILFRILKYTEWGRLHYFVLKFSARTQCRGKTNATSYILGCLLSAEIIRKQFVIKSKQWQV